MVGSWGYKEVLCSLYHCHGIHTTRSDTNYARTGCFRCLHSSASIRADCDKRIENIQRQIQRTQAVLFGHCCTTSRLWSIKDIFAIGEKHYKQGVFFSYAHLYIKIDGSVFCQLQLWTRHVFAFEYVYTQSTGTPTKLSKICLDETWRDQSFSGKGKQSACEYWHHKICEGHCSGYTHTPSSERWIDSQVQPRSSYGDKVSRLYSVTFTYLSVEPLDHWQHCLKEVSWHRI